MKRVPRSMPLISTANRGVSFKRTFFLASWTLGTTATTDFWKKLTPRFSDMPNAAEFQVLFDEYKMTGIKITFHPRFSSVQLAPSSGVTVSNNQLYITLANATREHEANPTGTYSSTTYNNFLEEMGGRSRTYMLNKPRSIYFKPTVYDETGTTTGYGFTHRPAPWQQINNSHQTQLHGCHAFLHDYNFNAQNTAGNGVDIQYTFYFQVRGQQ